MWKVSLIVSLLEIAVSAFVAPAMFNDSFRVTSVAFFVAAFKLFIL